MDSISNQLIQLLPAYGPLLLFALAVLETSFITGLVVPSGVATSIATVLALQGTVELVPMVSAAIAGGWIGDSSGFWVGRWSGDRILNGQGVWARKIAPKRHVLNELYDRHPIYSVTVARLISFVRTLMPMAAGASGLPYRTYLPYQAIGLLGCVGIYVGIGVVARESWEVATQVVGVGGTLIFAAMGVSVWRIMKRRIALKRRGAGGGPDA